MESIRQPMNGKMRCRLAHHLIGRWLAQIGREIAADPLDWRPVAERPQAQRTLHQAHGIKTRARDSNARQASIGHSRRRGR